MSYLVLARKSRPQTFDQVVGQRPVVRTLQNSLLRNRVAHAILFSGVRGVGKTTIARIMAKAINCQAERDERPCNNCPSCQSITSGVSLDLHEIDGASNRGIQEIRELKERIRFLPTSSKYKIIIIDEVHMLTTEAFNALLKTLEEPPAHVHFMFATTEIHKIPITILSRCQQYELKRVSAKELSDHFQKLALGEGFEIEPAALALIVREAGGSVRDGLSLLDQMFSFGEKKITNQDVVEVLGLVSREVLMQLTKGLLDGTVREVFLGLDEIFNFGIDLKRFIEDLMDHFRTLMLCKIEGCAKLIDLPDEELAEFKTLASQYTKESVHQKLIMLMSAAEELRFAAQPRLTLETAFLKMTEAGNVVPVTTLLGHLDNILAGLPICPPTTLPYPKSSEKSPQQGVPSKANGSQPVQVLPPQAMTNSPTPPAAPTPEPSRPPSHTGDTQNPSVLLPDDAGDKNPIATKQQIKIQPHEKDVRKDWMGFIQYVKEQKVWMAQDLQRADSFKQNEDGELLLTYHDQANCALLRQKENRNQLTEFVLDFFQKPLKVRFIIPAANDQPETNGAETPLRLRAQLASDPLVTMAAEIFNGEIGDIRISSRNK